MDLYTRLLKEREEDEQRRGRPLGMFHNVDSPALDRRLADAPEDLPRHGTDLHRLYRYAHRGSHKHRDGYEIRALR